MALDLDEFLPRKGKVPAPPDLVPLALEELNAYIAALEAEICRAKAAIDDKKAVQQAAQAFFKS
jgi:uncharacterized small protein (DUF1192 family)